MTVTIVRPTTDGAGPETREGGPQQTSPATPGGTGAPAGRGPARALALGGLVALTALGVWLAGSRGPGESTGVPGEPGRTNQSTVPGPVPPTPEPTRVPTASLPAAAPTTPAPRPTASLPAVGPTTPAPRPTASLPAVGPTTPAPRPTAP
jgi:hypothetical protein